MRNISTHFLFYLSTIALLFEIVGKANGWGIAGQAFVSGYLLCMMVNDVEGEEKP